MRYTATFIEGQARWQMLATLCKARSDGNGLRYPSISYTPAIKSAWKLRPM